MKKKSSLNWRIYAAIIWLVLTSSLAVWWMILGLRYIELSKKNMILIEGVTLITSLVVGE